MSWFEALILGIVQGLTEFLPVSSSGHLAIGKALFGIETSDLSFEIAVHAATVLATLLVFWKDILKLLQELFKFKMNDGTKYILMLLVSMIPVFIVGVLLKDSVENIFGSGLLVVGCCLVITAALLYLSEKLFARRAARGTDAGASGAGSNMSFKSALWMGLAQAVAVLPGLSRSGSTIATGLLCGVKREEVTRFSFLMVLIPILGEAFLDVAGGGFAASSVGGLQLAIGFLAAFVSGLFACKVMIAIVKRARLRWFALYCLIVGLACIISTLV
ncbi:MAG: undecaprenyl-diphosphate phosphatase [Bacteroidales bacterium]|nr:undecaprenyl-diphosphate phosphatase [Bacteroidales bacterium]